MTLHVCFGRSRLIEAHFQPNIYKSTCLYLDNLSLCIRYEIWFLLGSFVLVVAYQLLTGRINTKGLLLDKKVRSLSPGRIQLLMFTLVGALYYLLQVLENPTAFPDISYYLPLILGGSNLFYLGGKSYSSLFRR